MVFIALNSNFHHWYETFLNSVKKRIYSFLAVLCILTQKLDVFLFFIYHYRFVKFIYSPNKIFICQYLKNVLNLKSYRNAIFMWLQNLKGTLKPWTCQNSGGRESGSALCLTRFSWHIHRLFPLPDNSMFGRPFPQTRELSSLKSRSSEPLKKNKNRQQTIAR